jgi:hypothetical protein
MTAIWRLLFRRLDRTPYELPLNSLPLGPYPGRQLTLGWQDVTPCAVEQQLATTQGAQLRHPIAYNRIRARS